MSSFSKAGVSGAPQPRPAPQPFDATSFSLQGMRVAPREPGTEVAFVPKPEKRYPPENEGAYTIQNKKHFDQTVFKTGSFGYGGGFKINQEYREKMLSRKKSANRADHNDSDDEDGANKDQSLITREEIAMHLNLGTAEGSIGGKYGATSKTTLSKELCEGLEKDVEKLKRMEENIKMRRLQLIHNNKYKEDTSAEKEAIRIANIHKENIEAGAAILHADEKRLQMFRHKPGMLDTCKDDDEERAAELQRQREQLKQEADQMERTYWAKKENSLVGKQVRKKLAMKSLKEGGLDATDDEDNFEGGARPLFGPNSKAAVERRKQEKKEKQVTIKDDSFDSPVRGRSAGAVAKPALKHPEMRSAFDDDAERDVLEDKKPRSKSRASSHGAQSQGYKSAGSTKRRSQSRDPLRPASPRRQLYEAKYEKFLANKSQKDNIEQRAKALEPQGFDVITKQSSPSKKAAKLFSKSNAQLPSTSGKFESEELIPACYEDHLLKQELIERANRDPFTLLNVSQDDKMTFFLLKWVFNAIKQDAPTELIDKIENSSNDGVQMVTPYVVSKTDLSKQLVKNHEILHALDIKDPKIMEKDLKKYDTMSYGLLTWPEYMNFFFLQGDKSVVAQLTANGWWTKIDDEGNKLETRRTPEKDPERFAKQYEDVLSPKENSASRLLKEWEDVPVTPAIQELQKARRVRTEQEVEDAFNERQRQHPGGQGSPSQPNIQKKAKKPLTQSADVSGAGALDGFGLQREKSVCLLLPSHIETMREAFDRSDKYSDQILKRRDLIMALRTDERVVDFIDLEAVRVAAARSKVLTLDQVLVEVEKDEFYEQQQVMGKTDEMINHKEFITWREFLTYFQDYQEIEQRNKKDKNTQTREQLEEKNRYSKTEEPAPNPEEELKQLLETEKEARIAELPQLRPADQIDISQDQLLMIKQIFERVKGPTAENCACVAFFLALRKSGPIKRIASAIARDPEGTSRLPRETFQQVFDRMETDAQGKPLSWMTVIEYFTKRGRPLTKTEIQELKEQDRAMREEEAIQRRRAEEAERRRQQKLMEDLAEDEDFEAFEARQKNKEAMASADRPTEGDDNDDEEGDDLERESGAEDYGDEDDDDDLESDQETGLRRARSAKVLPTRKPPARLTAQDYHARDEKKGKYGITVPKPFGFDLREKVRAKSIRERRVEQMVVEKNQDEKDHINQIYRATPIPPVVVQPRYQAIVQQNEDRRLSVKQHAQRITKQNEAKFKFYDEDLKRQAAKKAKLEQMRQVQQYQIKANELPQTSSIMMYDQMLKIQAEKRLKNVESRAAEQYSKAKMPERMAEDLVKRRQNDAQMKKKPPLDPECTFIPNKGNKTKETADKPIDYKQKFASLQKAFENKLMATKAAQPERVDKPFNLKTDSRALVKRPSQTMLNEKEPIPQLDKLSQKLAQAAKAKATQNVPPPNVSSTKAVQLQQQKRREQQEAELAAKAKLEAEDKLRAETRKQIAKTMTVPRVVREAQTGKNGIGANLQKLRMMHSFVEEEDKKKEEELKKQEAIKNLGNATGGQEQQKKYGVI